MSIINTPDRNYLRWLVEGVKTAEGRVNKTKYKSMKIGDSILIRSCSTGEFLFGMIKFKREYKTFKEMLISEGCNNMLPFLRENQIDEACSVYEAFPNSVDVQRFGCVAIGVDIKESFVI